MTKKILSPVTASSYMVTTEAILTSFIGEYASIKGETLTVSSENTNGVVLTPAQQVSA
jgi:hypothetical protein